MPLAVKNYFSTLFFILVTYSFYSSLAYYRDFFSGAFGFVFVDDFGFGMRQVFLVLIFLYIIGLIHFYRFHTEKGKALLVVEYAIKKLKNIYYKPKKEETVALLSWGVKIFFAPLMVFWFFDHMFSLINTLYIVGVDRNFESFLLFFNTYGFWLVFNIIFFVDVFFFTLGYLLESPYLKNTIKSVEPTLIGWVVTLICYPPFNTHVTNMVGWYSEDFPQFSNFYVHLGLNITILLLLCVYAWASLSLGWKASNLTNRGIVASGPYKYVRHPAYITKNLAWWIGAGPMAITAISSSDYKFFGWILLGTLGWSLIYFLRAITEERHLSQDPDYREYTKKVKCKFIPGIY